MPEEYSVSSFYTRSRDSTRNHASYRVNIPEQVSGEIAALVASGKVPEYRTSGDVIRDALVHRLKWLDENLPDMNLEDAIKWEVSMNGVLKSKQSKEMEEHTVSSMVEMLKGGSPGEKGRLKEQARGLLDCLIWDGPKEVLRYELSKY